jgi:suppressor of ftsI
MRPCFVLLLVIVSYICLPVWAKNEPFANPPELKAVGGRLEVTLVAELSQTTIDGAPAQLTLFNGSYIPPTLRLSRGDTLLMTIVNKITDQTNIHFHGWHVSPKANADNSFFLIPATVSHTYNMTISSNHRQGLYYYHSHSMDSENQVFQGLAGLLIVEGLTTPLNLPSSVRELLFAVRDLKLSGGVVVKNFDLSGSSVRTVNGIGPLSLSGLFLTPRPQASTSPFSPPSRVS